MKRFLCLRGVGRRLPRPWLAAIVVRLLVLLYGATVVILGNPYAKPPLDEHSGVGGSELGRLDSFVRLVLLPFANWDGEYFMTIASRGYEYEKFHAFFPLLPWLISGLRCVRLARGEIFWDIRPHS